MFKEVFLDLRNCSKQYIVIQVIFKIFIAIILQLFFLIYIPNKFVYEPKELIYLFLLSFGLYLLFFLQNIALVYSRKMSIKRSLLKTFSHFFYGINMTLIKFSILILLSVVFGLLFIPILAFPYLIILWVIGLAVSYYLITIHFISADIFASAHSIKKSFQKSIAQKSMFYYMRTVLWFCSMLILGLLELGLLYFLSLVPYVGTVLIFLELLLSSFFYQAYKIVFFSHLHKQKNH